MTKVQDSPYLPKYIPPSTPRTIEGGWGKVLSNIGKQICIKIELLKHKLFEGGIDTSKGIAKMQVDVINLQGRFKNDHGKMNSTDLGAILYNLDDIKGAMNLIAHYGAAQKKRGFAELANHVMILHEEVSKRLKETIRGESNIERTPPKQTELDKALKARRKVIEKAGQSEKQKAKFKQAEKVEEQVRSASRKGAPRLGKEQDYRLGKDQDYYEKGTGQLPEEAFAGEWSKDKVRETPREFVKDLQKLIVELFNPPKGEKEYFKEALIKIRKSKELKEIYRALKPENASVENAKNYVKALDIIGEAIMVEGPGTMPLETSERYAERIADLRKRAEKLK